jgi:DNA replication protein DnaC
MRGKIISMFKLSLRIRDSYKRNEESEKDILEEMAQVPILVIDELGRSKGQDAERNWLSYIIDERTANNLPIIINTNFHLRKDCKMGGCDDCIESILPNDVLSRFSKATILKLNGEDWRKK